MRAHSLRAPPTAPQTRDTNFGTVASCRVPLRRRNTAQWGPNVRTGCVSCCSGDKGAPIWWFHSGWREYFEQERERGKGGARAGGGAGGGAGGSAGGVGGTGARRRAEESDEEEDPEIAERIKRLKQMG